MAIGLIHCTPVRAAGLGVHTCIDFSHDFVGIDLSSFGEGQGLPDWKTGTLMEWHWV
jgi:hypothetical protein